MVWGWVAAQAGAQVVARQGDSTETVSFKSPMVLELPMAQLAGLEEGLGMPFKGLEKYLCDDARLTSLVGTRTRASEKKGDVYTFQGVIAVGDSHDRWVDLDFELIVAEKVLAKAAVADLDAEEDQERIFQVKLQVPPEATAKLKSEKATAQLRLTLRVEDNYSWDGIRPGKKKPPVKKRRY